MAIQVRRGNEVDFDPSKMLPGEWAVSLDTKYVRMCFSPGVCLRMATYEAFEADMGQIKAILAEAESIEEAVAKIQTEINDTAVVVEDYSILAKSYAVGGTGKRENEDTDNAKYYYEQAKHISQGGNGLIPLGTIAFENLPTEDILTNGMYNISNDFTSDERFIDGGGVLYGKGSNVYYTVNGLWDVLAASDVKGVKGANESVYRQGNVSLSAADVGAAPVAAVSEINNKIANHRMQTFYNISELGINSWVLADIINAMPIRSTFMCITADLTTANPDANIPSNYGTVFIHKIGVWNISIETIANGQLYQWLGNQNSLNNIVLTNALSFDGNGNKIADTYLKKEYNLLLDSTSSNELSDSITNYNEIVMMLLYEGTSFLLNIPAKLFKDGLISYGNSCKFCETRYFTASNYQTWQVNFKYPTGFVSQVINNDANVDRANYRIIVFGR